MRLLGKHQLGVELSRRQRESVLAFLTSLAGQVDEEYNRQPELPESGPDTPAPDPS